MEKQQHQILWEKCCQFISDNIPEAQFRNWFGDIKSVSFDPESRALDIMLPTEFYVEMLESRFASILRAGIRKVYGDDVKLFYNYPTVKGDKQSEVSTMSDRPSTTILAQEAEMPANPFLQAAPRQNFQPQLNPKYTFENYCGSHSNQIARSIGQSIGDNPSLKTFNPLFVFGPTGVGKTHLIQAIGIRIKETNPQARVLYITARLFESQFTAANAKGNINNFYHFYQSIDTLIIDDIQDLQNKPGTQNTFFHIFNHLHQNNKQIIMSSDCAPSQMEGFEARLLSRFKWGMSVELDRPDLDLRRTVLTQKALQNGLRLPDDVLEYIVANVTDSIRELEGIMTSLVAHAMALNTEISLDLAKRVVSNSVKISRRTINFEMISQAVTSHYGLSDDVLFTKMRKREVSDARQVVMYLAKKLIQMPLTIIGQHLGRSHSTVIYACNNIEERIAVDKKLSADINAIEAALCPAE